MNRAHRVALVGVLGGALVCLALVCLALFGGATGNRGGEDDSSAPIARRAAPSETWLEALGDLAASPRSKAGAAGAHAPQLLDHEALARLLEELQAAYAADEYRELERLLSRLLESPAQLRAVVARLVEAGATLGGEAVRGALLALEAGIALYERDSARFGAAGSETIALLLDALPAFSEELQAPIVRLLQRVRGANGRALDERFLAQLLDLRANHPDQKDVFVPLLGTLAESELGPEHGDAFRRLFLDGEDDPLLVKCALSALLSEDPGTYLPVARELHARNPEDFELRGAIAQSIASSAPVAEAADALSTLTDGADYAAFMTLASRPGAAEVIASTYAALLADGANPNARKMLVSAMSQESDEVLLGIARMDPEPTVGLQAALGLTLRGPIDAQRFADVRGLFEEGRQHPSGAAMVAENVMVNSSGAARDAARNWLVELVRNPNLSDAVRTSAFTRVRRWVPAGTFAGIHIGGQALE